MKLTSNKIRTRVLLLIASIIVVIICCQIYMHVNRLPERIFDSVSELNVAEEYASFELEYDNKIEPKQDVISGRWAKQLSFEGEVYDLYAYEFSSVEEAREFFVKTTNRQTEKNYGHAVNFSKKTPLVMFRENNLYMLFYNDAGYSDVVELLEVITKPFEYDLEVEG